MARPDTWMPLKIGPWTKKTARLSAAERGAYMELLLAYWVGGPLPADDEDTLKRLARCTDKEWRAVRGKVLAYFTRDGDVLRQSRADEEMAEANQRYERRASAGKAGGKAKAKQTAKQNPSNATAEPQASYKEQSSNDEASLRDAAPKPVKGTRLAVDWQPSPDGYAYARERNLEHAEIAGVALPKFIRIFTSPDLKKPIRKGWDRTWCNFIDDESPRIIANRTREQRPAGNLRRDQSITAATDSILAKAGIRRAGGVGEVRDSINGVGGVGDAGGAGNPGTVIDADDWRRVPESSEGTEGSDAADAGDDRGPRNAAGGLPEAVDGIPGGRGSVRDDDTAEIQPVVALVAGPSREVGTPDASAPEASGGDDDYGTIPDFLRRQAN